MEKFKGVFYWENMLNWQRLDVLNNYVHIMSPTMAVNDTAVFSSYRAKRDLVEDFHKLEAELKNEGYDGWFSWTLFSRPHVMRLFTKVGARPYMSKTFKDPSKDMIWFIKEV